LRLLLADAHLREHMGANGKRYVQKNYGWDIILGKYEQMFARLRQQGRK
jgi:glycosyltransferase involved in cell wall biosynthesis